MSAWELHHGDCLQRLPSLPPGAAHAVITDPPYGIGFSSNAVIGRRGKTILNDDRPFIWFLHEAYRVTCEGGALVCFHRWDVQETWRVAIEAAGFEVRSQLVWDRQARGMGDLDGAPAPVHDLAWFAVKGDFKFPGRRPESVIRVTKPHWKAATHPTEKPLGLMLEVVQSFVAPGGLVVDPFAGSGSTGEACVVSGRRFWGCELDPDHHRRATERLRQAAPLFAACEQQGEFGGE